MLLLRAERLPEGPDWLCELKLDGCRAQAIKTGGKVKLRSGTDKDSMHGTRAWWKQLLTHHRCEPAPIRAKLEQREASNDT
jgi:hypothetical protein